MVMDKNYLSILVIPVLIFSTTHGMYRRQSLSNNNYMRLLAITESTHKDIIQKLESQSSVEEISEKIDECCRDAKKQSDGFFNKNLKRALSKVASYGRLDLLRLYLGYDLDAAPYDFLCCLAEKCFKSGQDNLFKYLMSKVYAKLRTLDLLNSLEWQEFGDDVILYCKTPDIFQRNDSERESLVAWIDIFQAYVDETRFLFIADVVGWQGRLSVLLQDLEDDDLPYVDAEAKSIFGGTYFESAITNIFNLYKNSDKKTQEIFLEAAQICGHHDIEKLFKMYKDNAFCYVQDRKIKIDKR